MAFTFFLWFVWSVSHNAQHCPPKSSRGTAALGLYQKYLQMKAEKLNVGWWAPSIHLHLSDGWVTEPKPASILFHCCCKPCCVQLWPNITLLDVSLLSSSTRHFIENSGSSDIWLSCARRTIPPFSFLRCQKPADASYVLSHGGQQEAALHTSRKSHVLTFECSVIWCGV